MDEAGGKTPDVTRKNSLELISNGQNSDRTIEKDEDEAENDQILKKFMTLFHGKQTLKKKVDKKLRTNVYNDLINKKTLK